MALNSIKCYFMCIGQKRENKTFIFRDVCYKNSKEKVMLGVITDNKLTFDCHIKKNCKKDGQKCTLENIKVSE